MLFVLFVLFLDIFLGEHWIFGPLFGPLGPFLFHLLKFWSQFSPFWSFWSLSIHFWTIFWSIFGHLVVYFSCAFLSSLTSTKKVEGCHDPMTCYAIFTFLPFPYDSYYDSCSLTYPC